MSNFPKWLVIQLLEHCDLRCKMCYEWGETGSYFNKKKLHKLNIDAIKDVLNECSPSNTYLGLFGGEPLIYPDICELLETICNLKLNVDIPTNGTRLAKLAELLVDTKVKRLWISLDGPKDINDAQRGKGVFEQVVKGIEILLKVREKKGSKLPGVGITYIVTPLSYRYIERFFMENIDLKKLDHISIEFQSYITPEKYNHYREFLKTEFDIQDAPIAKGLITDPSYFNEIDTHVLFNQILKIKTFCEKNNIYFISYPKTIDENNYKNYFTADWSEMSDKRTRCAFPWIYAEINAEGHVNSCHTLYDLTFGNIYKKSIYEIWNSKEYEKFRRYAKKQLLPICTGCARYYSDPNKK